MQKKKAEKKKLNVSSDLFIYLFIFKQNIFSKVNNLKRKEEFINISTIFQLVYQ